MYLGEVSGVAVNSKGHIFVFSRGNTTGPAYGASAAQLLEFGPDGKYIREIGHNLYAWSFAHTVKSRQGRQHLGRRQRLGHGDQVQSGRPRRHGVRSQAGSLGRRNRTAQASQPPLPPVDGMFRQVTDMAWDAAGNTFISDGYINSRVAKVDKDGKWIKSLGEPGDRPGQLNTPHSIAADAQGNVYVADRGNRRIQVFDGDGKLPATDHNQRAL